MEARASVEKSSGDRWIVRLAGDWRMDSRRDPGQQVQDRLEAAGRIEAVGFDTSRLGAWDTRLLTFLIRIRQVCRQRGVPMDSGDLPAGVRRLLALAAAQPRSPGQTRAPSGGTLLELTGRAAVAIWQTAMNLLAFTGEVSVAAFRLATGRARMRWTDVLAVVQNCGPQALPIVSLISALVGLILAFMGAVQLKVFGAEIYVAALVGIAMVRVMGAVMAGVIMAGRTGAAFAAQLGTMQVNEEIDALRTMGIAPMEFLVLPRMLALTLMMPLLCLYADLMGLLGGLLVGVSILDLNPVEYVNMTIDSIRLKDLGIGLFQSAVFGVLIALAGCMQGIQCGRSASAVGTATTAAVVSGIVYIVVATAVITIGCDMLGI